MIAALACAQALKDAGRTGAIVTLICDGGERYRLTYFNDAWLSEQQLECDRESDAVDTLIDSGSWPAALQAAWQLGGDLKA